MHHRAPHKRDKDAARHASMDRPAHPLYHFGASISDYGMHPRALMPLAASCKTSLDA